MRAVVCVVLLLLSISVCVERSDAFYVPASAARVRVLGEPLTVEGNALQSFFTQSPIAMFASGLCSNGSEVALADGLGELLLGDRWVLTSMHAPFMANGSAYECSVELGAERVWMLRALVLDRYSYMWRIDGMLATMEGTPLPYVPLGFVGAVAAEAFLYTTMHVRVLYHRETLPAHSEPAGVVVGVRVSMPDGPRGTGASVLLPSTAARMNVTWSVTFDFVESDIEWQSSYDALMPLPDDTLHVLVTAAVLSFVLALLGGGVLLCMCVRARREVHRYEAAAALMAMEDDDDVIGDTEASGTQPMLGPAEFYKSGWPLVYADVLRAPRRFALLSVLLGAGANIAAAVLVTLLASLTGLVSPANRGAWLTVLVLSYSALGVLAGFVSSRVHRILTQVASFRVALLSVCVVLLPVSVVWLVRNFILIAADSSAAVPAGTAIVLGAAVLLAGFLSLAGRFLAARLPVRPLPVPVNDLPRSVPAKPAWLRALHVGLVVVGLEPFAAMFQLVRYGELQMWLGVTVYAPAVYVIIAVMTIVIVAVLGALITHLFLSYEDYEWWWRAFFAGASTGAWVAAYLVYMGVAVLSLSSAQAVFSFMFHAVLVSVAVSAALGCCSFLGALLHVVLVYRMAFARGPPAPARLRHAAASDISINSDDEL